ncbi:putative RNA-directed DNA polymerase [Helianthus annuus]|nr:putative RNA-directed DNA polymerase [Helianthus annuus]
MSEKGLKVLVEKRKFQDLKKVEIDIGFCEPCVLGKKKCVSLVKSGKQLKEEKLELVHTDVFGPTPVSSLEGSNYYVTFMGDATRKPWVLICTKCNI